MASMSIQVVAFDADDTLWVNEPRYKAAELKLQRMMTPYAEECVVSARLHDVDVRNLDVFGYGVKGFILAMIQTAIELSHGELSASKIGEILEEGRRIATIPVEPFNHVKETLSMLSRSMNLMLITKGDTHEQSDRIARSGLRQYFRNVEIVSEKSERIYTEILAKHEIAPEEFVMVGNAMKSDILPVIAIGGHAVYIHCPDT